METCVDAQAIAPSWTLLRALDQGDHVGNLLPTADLAAAWLKEK
jgi:hypothetical protein